MARLSREQLLSPGAATRDVDVPELGGSVTIRRITVGERDQAVADAPEDKGSYAVVACAISDPEDMTLDDVLALQIPVYERLSVAIYQWNNFIATDEEGEDATAGEEAAMSTFPARDSEGSEA